MYETCCLLVIQTYANIWYAHVKEQRRFDIEVKGQGHTELMMYATHRTMVIHSRAKQSMTMSKDKKA